MTKTAQWKLQINIGLSRVLTIDSCKLQEWLGFIEVAYWHGIAGTTLVAFAAEAS
jgi:hypothetical protein